MARSRNNLGPLALLSFWLASSVTLWPAAAPAADERWAFQPPSDVPVAVNDGDNPIDHFILVALKARGLNPAPPADKYVLIRRATYDLTGLPPTLSEVEGFVADTSADAYAKVIDRLLASPRYGERWGRHWLDLVRYTDTDDFNEAWRYRDWVIKSFNQDLPYDQFVMYQIAGDLLPVPSAVEGPPSDPATAINVDGIVATTMLSLGTSGGIDPRKRLTDVVDDQIDTIGRSFLGLTLACARCHDHKYDPVSIQDYYGLAGIFFSSHVIPDTGYRAHANPRLKVPLVGPAEVEAHARHMKRVRAAEGGLAAEVDRHYSDFAAGLLPHTARYLLAAYDYEHRPTADAGVSVEQFAQRQGLQEYALRRWTRYLGVARVAGYRLLGQSAREFDGEPGIQAWRTAAERPWWAANTTGRDVGIETFYLPAGSVSINPGGEGGAVGWKSPVTGTVRITGKLMDGDPHDGTGVAWILDHESAAGRHELTSGRLAKDVGTMQLEEGRLPRRMQNVPVKAGDVLYLHIQLGDGDAHYDITNVELNISRIDGERGEWNLARDVSADLLAGNPHADSLGNAGVWHFYDGADSHRLGRMPSVDALLAKVWDPARQADRAAVESVAKDIEQAVVAAGVDGPLMRDLTSPQSPFWVDQRDDARYLPAAAREAIAKLTSELDALKGQTPSIPYAHGIAEGGLRYGPSPGFRDVPVHVRGNYDQLGPAVTRRFPIVLAGAQQPPIRSGSGRLELARWIASADNPLTARVMVNRIWQHHFGHGIVRTPSNFGRLGEAPTHPQLLDYLARRFVQDGWSLKKIHRLIMLSATYRQASSDARDAVAADPDNRLLGRMNRRRLEAEAVRDSLLALAGRLEERTGGPANSDSNSPRRLVYLTVSRGERSDFAALFDRANPALHVEERTVSTAAVQALHLMNSTFVMEQAQALANRPEIAAELDPARRIDMLYRLILARPAATDEIALGRKFLDAASTEAAQTPDGPSAWARYVHGLLLSNEFLFVE